MARKNDTRRSKKNPGGQRKMNFDHFREPPQDFEIDLKNSIKP